MVIFIFLIRIQNNFNDTALADIFATDQVVVVVGPGSGNGWHSISSSFTPSEFSYLSWNDSGLSAIVTPSPLINGGVVYSFSFISAMAGFSYACQDGFFLDGQYNSWVGKHQIGVINNSTDTLTFGVGQEVYTNSMMTTGLTMMEAILPMEDFAFTLQSFPHLPCPPFIGSNWWLLLF